MSYFLPIGETVALQKSVEPGGIIIFQSGIWDADLPRKKDNTRLNLFNGDDCLLCISIRRKENAIIFNSHVANGTWGCEERVPLQGAFVTPNINIMVYDHGDRYQILVSYQTVHYYLKRINVNTTNVSYAANPNKLSPLSDMLVVSTYDSMEEMVTTNYHACSGTGYSSPLVKSPSDNAKIKATFNHGVGLIAQPGKKKKDYIGFEYAKYCFLGDAVTLTCRDGHAVLAKEYPFKLPNGLYLTYGEISSLAGDFYGTEDPISDGNTEQGQFIRFQSAYKTLTDIGPRQPDEAKAILKVLQKEVDVVNEALHNHEDPSVAYSKLPDETATFENITGGRSGVPSYLDLAKINWDHFGVDARTAYNAGHEAALEAAVRGSLENAYIMNAFADHFLEDSFSAGHLRTPRRLLHSTWNLAADYCAKLMHDEDNAIGISVENPAGQKWIMYGGKRALDAVNSDNNNRCLEAVQASAEEIYHAWKTKKVPDMNEYKAWDHSATLESARDRQVLAPLFTAENQRRVTITSRYNWKFTEGWQYLTTAAECFNSGWWKYPITIDGPRGILSGSAVASTTPSLWSCRVYCQDSQGGIREVIHDQGIWTTRNSELFKAKMFTPLAIISWDEGREIRIYCLSQNDFLREYCYSSNGRKNGWYSGHLNNLNVHAASNSSIAAIQWKDNDGPQIRLYCQESTSDAIQEFCSGNPWTRGTTLPIARTGSSIAAVSWMKNGIHMRVYYQDPSLALKEHCSDGGWYEGCFNPGRVPRHSSITALGWYDSCMQLRVYWQDSRQTLVGTSWINGSWGSVDHVTGPLLGGRYISAVDWKNGKNIRIYYQGEDGAILEECNDGGKWFRGVGAAKSA
ncbi:MAG: hypothetical protein M1834_004897 [Cirrosporium novae-zelandiae]|nr:MAG: hypothetical protein M1834_004897 [Cirrosporium novae-zelandiae]